MEVDRGRDTEADVDGSARSAEPCPVCGAHRLATLDFPPLASAPYLPAHEAYGVPTEIEQPGLPAIGCLACGADWPSLEAFRAAQRGEWDGDDATAEPEDRATP